MTIQWREKMTIDDGVIDQDHRHLIDIINRFENAAKDGLTLSEGLEILFALKFYASTHFKREEQLQRLIDFPFYDSHKREHEELIEKLSQIIDELKMSQESSYNTVARHTAVLLREWLVDHVLHSDLRMKVFVDALRDQGRDMKALSSILPE